MEFIEVEEKQIQKFFLSFLSVYVEEMGCLQVQKPPFSVGVLTKGVAVFGPTKKLADMSKFRYLNLYLRKTSNGLSATHIYLVPN